MRYSEFKVSYAIAVGGVRAIALMGHTNCGMSNLAGRREMFAHIRLHSLRRQASQM